MGIKADYTGLRKLKRLVAPIGNAEVQVGFFDKTYPGHPTEAHPEGYNVGVHVAEVAYWNNIDTNDAPARPFMRETVMHRRTRDSLKAAIKNVLAGSPVNKELKALGEKEVNLMKKIIEDYHLKDHNSQSWIELKGFDDVLQYTDFMLKSVEYRVKKSFKI